MPDDNLDIPVVEVAALIVECKGKILAVYNPRWSLFTLPMTKRRVWTDPEVAPYEEIWEEAAARAAAECLRRTFPAKTFTKPVKKMNEYWQFDFSADGLGPSGRERRYKHYKFQIFKVTIAPDSSLPRDLTYEWLAPEDFTNRQGLSPTARAVVAQANPRCQKD